MFKLFKLTLQVMTEVAAVSYCSLEIGFIRWKETLVTKVQHLDLKQWKFLKKEWTFLVS